MMTPRKLTLPADRAALQVRVDRELYKWLVEQANAQGVTLTALVTAILEAARDSS